MSEKVKFVILLCLLAASLILVAVLNSSYSQVLSNNL